MILNHEMIANEKLPSKRKLSLHLKISQITVETAYMQLKAEGYIKSIEKVGYFVEAFTNLSYTQNDTLREVYHAQKPVLYDYDLKTNVVDPLHFPYDTWAKMERDVFLENKDGLLNSSDPEGLLELRIQISSILKQYRGINTSPDTIIVGAGTDVLLHLLILLLGKNLTYALETPGYPKLQKLYEAYDVEAKSIELDEFGIIVEELEKLNIDIVHVSPSHQFPTGIVMPVSRRNQLLQWAYAKLGRFIIEDDYDSEFRFSGNPIPAMQGIDVVGKVVYINSFSKSMAPTFRVSFMVLPPVLLQVFHQKYRFFSNTVPVFDQMVLARFIETKAFEKHLNRMKLIYKFKRDSLIDLFKNCCFGKYICFVGEEAGLHFIVRFEINISESKFIEAAILEGVRVYGLSEYALTKQTNAHLVIGYGNYQIDDFKNIIIKLERAWNQCHFI